MEKKLTIAVLLGLLINPRIEKRLKAEKEIADVHLISWDRGNNNMLGRPSEDGYTAHTILLKAKANPIRRMLPYIKFCKFAKKQLLSIKPDVIHAQNLDMLKIGIWYKKKINPETRLIYEIADLHTLIVDRQTNIVRKIAQRYLLREEKICARYIDLLIVTSEKYYDTYFKNFVPEEKMLYMPNVPDLSAFASYKPKEKNNDFVVGFIGAVRFKQQMKNLIEAGKKAGTRVLFAGLEFEPVEIEPLCRSVQGFEWYGKFDFQSEAAKIYEKCDAVFSVYDADMKNVRVALPNKLYEAVYCELPIIVAKGTYLEEIVNDWGVGVAVDHKDPDELEAVLRKLSGDKEFYDSLVSNCRKHKNDADLKFYNKKLLNFIENITVNK